jgi:diguanylate cyclase (GGDEF)-like protein
VNIKPLEPELKQRLPSPHGVALAIMDACRRENVSIGEVATLVQSDPALTGRLLEMANSAALGGRALVSVPEAVSRLGLLSVRQLALSFSLLDRYASGNCKEFNYADFWSHSLLMALAMKEFGVLLRMGSGEDLFTCGLLARIGCLAMATAYPKEYGKLIGTGTSGPKLLVLEREILHMDHLNLSAALLLQWGIPEPLVEPVLFHEDPASAQFSKSSRPWLLCQGLFLALKVSDFAMAPEVEQAHRIAELTEIGSRLGIDSAELGQHIDSVVRQWRALANKLSVKSHEVANFEEIKQNVLRPDEEIDSPWLRVLIAEDDPIVRNILESWLRDECQHTVKAADKGRDALAIALDFKPHVVITDWLMPEMNGLELCQALRSTDWGQNIYVLMLTALDMENELVAAFDAGVDDYLAKPVNMRALSARLKAAWRYVRLRDAWERDHERLTRMAAELALSNRRLQLAALTDPLTELANRRSGILALAQAWSATTRHGHPLTIISMDVDHFKSINDLHGHAAGDVVLQHIGQGLRAAARKEDTVCRWGGEEFLIISPNVDLKGGIQAAERLRKNVAALPITIDGKSISVTASFGLACWEREMVDQEQLLAHVDKALYAAKTGGRNRLAVFHQSKVRLQQSV